MTRYCQGHNPGHPRHTAYAVVTLQPSGNHVALCRPIFDIWLDNADDDSALEPSEIQFLSPPDWARDLKKKLNGWGYGPVGLDEAINRPWIQALAEHAGWS